MKIVYRLAIILVACCSVYAWSQTTNALFSGKAKNCLFSTPLPERAHACNAALRRTINIGNSLDTVKEGQQGTAFQDEFIQLSKKAGFDAIRLPIRWDARASLKEPYTIQPKFFERVDHIVNLAAQEKMALIIDMHHFVGMTLEPDTEVPRFLAVWKQVAERYKDAPANVMFEILNEPNGKLTPDKWQVAFNAVLPVIRASNPQRTLIVGGGEWNSANGLEKMELPATDQNLIGTFHFYEPMSVTHQGAEWVSGSTAWLGTKWAGTAEDRNVIENTFDRMVVWGNKNNRPVLLGEFGVYSKAEHSSRINWTRAVREAAEKRNIAWAYWELMSSFGILEPLTLTWRKELLETLIPPGAANVASSGSDNKTPPTNTQSLTN